MHNLVIVHSSTSIIFTIAYIDVSNVPKDTCHPVPVIDSATTVATTVDAKQFANQVSECNRMAPCSSAPRPRACDPKRRRREGSTGTASFCCSLGTREAEQEQPQARHAVGRRKKSHRPTYYMSVSHSWLNLHTVFIRRSERREPVWCVKCQMRDKVELSLGGWVQVRAALLLRHVICNIA